jgi:hypothetical protein
VISSLGQWALVVITIGIAWLVYWLKSKSVVYTLTTQRIQIERGLLSTIKASVELFRIDDFDIHRPFGMRALGYSMLHLRSSDPDLSTVIITGVPNLEALADQLRECSLKERTAGRSRPSSKRRTEPGRVRATHASPLLWLSERGLVDRLGDRMRGFIVADRLLRLG